jgi:hypothetical protein
MVKFKSPADVISAEVDTMAEPINTALCTGSRSFLFPRRVAKEICSRFVDVGWVVTSKVTEEGQQVAVVVSEQA